MWQNHVALADIGNGIEAPPKFCSGAVVCLDKACAIRPLMPKQGRQAVAIVVA